MRDKRLSVRVDADELTAIERNAAAARLSVTDFVRDAAKNTKVTVLATDYTEERKTIIILLQKTGIIMNQLLKILYSQKQKNNDELSVKVLAYASAELKKLNENQVETQKKIFQLISEVEKNDKHQKRE